MGLFGPVSMTMFWTEFARNGRSISPMRCGFAVDSKNKNRRIPDSGSICAAESHDLTNRSLNLGHQGCLITLLKRVTFVNSHASGICPVSAILCKWRVHLQLKSIPIKQKQSNSAFQLNLHHSTKRTLGPSLVPLNRAFKKSDLSHSHVPA